MRVPIGDFKLGVEEKVAINEVLDSGRISEGKKVKQFEDEWAEYVGTKYCVLTNSGTTALMAGLSCLDYTKHKSSKKEILTTPITYIATSNAVVLSGLKPVYVDVDINNFGITTENVKIYFEENPNNDIKAIMPVHLMGFPVDMDGINRIAKEHGVLTIEDSAQAHGSYYNGKRTGSHSLLSFFSFYIAHNIQAGEMGAVNTDDPEIRDYVNKIKANGRMCDCRICSRPKGFCVKGDIGVDPRFSHDIIGGNYKVMEFQAALGLVQLKRVNDILKQRQDNVKYLNEGLQEFSNILQLPPYSTDISYLAYPMVIKDLKINRERLRLMLEKEGVETRPLFGSIPTQQPAYSHLKEKYQGKLHNADYLGLNAFYIGCHQYLNQEQLDYIISSFKKVLGEYK
ncbi:MAG: DegT/DnrJ/EryC1/StrS family aminotransferase [archaeon]